MSVSQPPPLPASTSRDAEIKIVSHSHLFYWWPVWAVGFLMFLLTLFDGHRLIIAPEGTKSHRETKTIGGKEVVIDSYVEPEKDATRAGDAPADPRLHAAKSKSYGVLFLIVLLLVTLITNVPLRGMWSVVVVVVLVLTSIIFALAGWWEAILNALDLLHIYINAGGYLFFSLALFAIWLVTFLLFDQQIYMVFTPGQLKVKQEIGGAEKAYDTAGMTVEKQRSDLFRHWILGLGSGDLIVNTSGAQAHHFDLPNVLFIGKKVEQIESMLREKAVVRAR
jgi:hypothetical protein